MKRGTDRKETRRKEARVKKSDEERRSTSQRRVGIDYEIRGRERRLQIDDSNIVLGTGRWLATSRSQ